MFSTTWDFRVPVKDCYAVRLNAGWPVISKREFESMIMFRHRWISFSLVLNSFGIDIHSNSHGQCRRASAQLYGLSVRLPSGKYSILGGTFNPLPGTQQTAPLQKHLRIRSIAMVMNVGPSSQRRCIPSTDLD